jgi:hypothetical protein
MSEDSTISRFLFDGKYDDFSVEWFNNVGTMLVD